MNQLLLGMVLFFGMHSISIVAPRSRDALAARSEMGWKLAYTLVSLAGLVLIIRGYAQLRLTPVVLYVPPAWLDYLAAVLLLPVFALFLAPYFPGRIKRATKHPQLIAVMLWAAAHLLANGTLGDVLLFGSFLAWAVADRLSMERRAPRPVPGAPPSAANDAIVVVVGLILYVATLLWLHEWLFGVPPLVALE